jgi:hypothetical protein
MAYLCADRFASYAAINIVATADYAPSTVAPLGVHFSAVGTTANVALPFHDLLYVWDFDDPTSSTFTPTGLSKDEATGPIAKHVYETPGTYTPTLTVFDGLATKVYTFAPITVIAFTDIPGYVAADTICFSNDADFTGAPAGSTQIGTVSDYDAQIATYLATGKRLLFKRDDAFTTSTQALFNKQGPWLVGAFGTGAKPTVTRTAGTTIIGVGEPLSTVTDGRFMDHTLNGATRAASGIVGRGDFSYLTVTGVDTVDCDYGAVFVATLGAGVINEIWENFIFQEFTVSAAGEVGFFGDYRKLGLLGVTVDDVTNGEHCIRTMWLQDSVIQSCTGIQPAATKHCLTIRAPDYAAGSGIIPAGTYTERVVISDFRAVGDAGVVLPVELGAPDASEPTRQRDVIFERGMVTFQAPHGGDITTLGISIYYSEAATPVTVRNNIVNLTGCGVNNQRGIGFSVDATGARVWNNSCTTNDTGSGTFRSIFIADNTTVGMSIQNNAGWAPNFTSYESVSNTNVNGTGASGTFGNSTDNQVKNTCPFADTTPTNPAIGEFNAANYAIGGGVSALQVYDNYLGAQRSYGNTAPVMNVGAV